MKKYCYTVDDNIKFFAQITEMGCDSIFDHPYLAMYKRLHERFGVKVQLNLFFEADGFTLADFPDRYKDEWRENSSWLKLSFHSRLENSCPYENSEYDEVHGDCTAVNQEIIRFASEDALAKTTTVHYCLTTPEGHEALKDCGVKGLLGLYGTDESPRVSYSIPREGCEAIRAGKNLHYKGITHAAIDVILNLYTKEQIIERFEGYSGREHLHMMIHEQYYYPDYPAYQPDFEEKLVATFTYLEEKGYTPDFFENMI
ncbi:MAG: hypothetical protein IJ519_02260 [Clostridia bacterium]|nr:hypothetical protein [Clostridia bacterium]